MPTKQAQPVDLAPVYNEVARFIASAPTSEQIAAFWLSASSEKLVTDLMKAKQKRSLTPAEQAAFEEYQRIESLMLQLKIQAFAKLNPSP
jgi:hypothetical protein